MAPTNAGDAMACPKAESGYAMIVAGIGCKRGANPEDINAAITKALDACNLAPTRLDALATASDKCDEPGIRAVAAQRDLPLIDVSKADLENAAPRALTSSNRVQAIKGVPSICETAALAAIGAQARLLAPRVTNATATSAIASDNHIDVQPQSDAATPAPTGRGNRP